VSGIDTPGQADAEKLGIIFGLILWATGGAAVAIHQARVLGRFLAPAEAMSLRPPRTGAPSDGAGRIQFRSAGRAKGLLDYGLPVRGSRPRSVSAPKGDSVPYSEPPEKAHGLASNEFDPEYLAIVEAIVHDGRQDAADGVADASGNERVKSMLEQLRAPQARFLWFSSHGTRR
jgi:hypothetical protein